MNYPITHIRSEFPLLNRAMQKNLVVYLDSASTSQKPKCVLDAMDHYLRRDNANINRGVHPLAEASTIAYEAARSAVARFIGARDHEIIFTKNATESVNLVARSFGDCLQKNDVIVLSTMEHHSNIVPWQQLAERRGVTLAWIGIDDDGLPDITELTKILTTRSVKLVTMTGLSNVLGSMPDIAAITKLAHEHGAVTLVDAAQLAAHAMIDVRTIDCDFLVFSSHKIYGPTGIGILYGKQKHLNAMPAFLGGGDMIARVTTEGYTVAELPRKFEAGTPPIMEAVGLHAALQWIERTGLTKIIAHEHEILTHAQRALASMKGLRILGPKNPMTRRGCISFTVDGLHPHDLTHVLGDEGICLRAGHHCTEPLHRSLGINASARLSVAAYNTIEEIDRCMDTISRARTKLLR